MEILFLLFRVDLMEFFFFLSYLIFQHTFYKQTLLTLQSLHSQAVDDKDAEMTTNGMAALNLDVARLEPTCNNLN